MGKRVLLLLVMLLMLIVSVEARYKGGFHRGDRFSEAGLGLYSGHILAYKTELQLSKQQETKIRELCDSHQENVIKKQADIRLSQNRLHRLFQADDIDRREAEKLIKESETLRTELKLLSLEQHLAVRNLLSAEQLAKLRDFQYERRLSRYGKKPERERRLRMRN